MVIGERHRKKFVGIVTSNRMHKTVVVEVTRQLAHPKYEKRYRVKKKYKAHDEKQEYKVDDRVIIEATKPLGRDKHFRVIGKL